MNVNQHEQDLKALRERLGEQRKVIYGLLALAIIGALQFLTNEDTMSVVMKGRLVTVINGSRVETGGEGRAYLATFQYSGNKIQLQTFKEIPYETSGTNHAALLSDSGGVHRN